MKLFYFTDPMCSWCYGFSPVLKKLKENYPEIELEIIPGGFSPFSKQTITPEYKEFLEFHWRNVNLRSGQPFDHSMKFATEAFHYDTEPSSRALAVIQTIVPERDFEFLSLMQTAFYVKGKDITNGIVLAGLAERIGVDKSVFFKHFNSEAMKQKTIRGFQCSRNAGVQGFPTLLTMENGAVNVVTRGFQSFENLKVSIDGLIRKMSLSDSAHGPACADGFCEY
ncbi:DsbA family protein [Spirosoma foliorum]|uniref:DsbA family protein n=1 Tax=Spirosoma foliorum TaxID=2710596 RepID=A0A7G5H1F6_9BACT|nr:DsbA family protein [Spirosoma foliorum]QMW04948.1 DsbA family protein [Spirosoma foliorum]